MRDTSATFQFLVDALRDSWRIVAPDWRGHGLTHAAPQGVWFHELLADLEALLRAWSPNDPVRLVGHSLGGNVAGVYAGVRPDRVSHVVSIDGFGVPGTNPAVLASLLSRWLRTDPAPRPKRYSSVTNMARKLAEANRRLTWDKALYLAAHSSRRLEEDGFAWQFYLPDRRSLPTLHSLEEWIACWGAIRARALWIVPADARPGTVGADAEAFAQVSHALGDGSLVRIADTGHNVHHDAPGALAAVIESFLRGSPRLESDAE
jgi:pimeloyl-ACP methyl ester carboxylesterase